MSEEKSGMFDAERLLTAFINIRDKKEALESEYNEKVEKLTQSQNLIREKLNEIFQKTNMESIKTKVGTAYRSIKTKYGTNDWESLHNFIIDNKVPEMLQKRINAGVMKEWLEKYPTKIPKGLNTFNEYQITIRRKK